MKCTNCGAQTSGNYCEYCGASLQEDKNNNINNNIVINNYYVDPYYLNNKNEVKPCGQLLYSEKDKNITLLLCIFIGYLGIHNFYVGKIGMGILYFFTGGLFGFGWLLDIILIATNSFKDGKGLIIKSYN